MAARVLIVGEAPGARNSGGLTRRRLSELAGQPWEEWADWRNLLDDYPGPGNGKGTLWNKRAADQAARDLVASGAFAPYDRVILLGRRVAAAFIPAGAGFPLFRWVDLGGSQVAVIPHTSGIVRFWNAPANVDQARGFIQEILHSTQAKEVKRMATETDTKQETPKGEEVDLQRELIDRVRETVGSVTETRKKGYIRISTEDGATLGFVHTQTRSGVRIDVPAEGGGYTPVRVEKRGDLRKAVAVIEKRAEKAATPAA